MAVPRQVTVAVAAVVMESYNGWCAADRSFRSFNQQYDDQYDDQYDAVSMRKYFLPMHQFVFVM